MQTSELLFPLENSLLGRISVFTESLQSTEFLSWSYVIFHPHLQGSTCMRRNPYVNFLDFKCAAGIGRYKPWLVWVGFFCLFLTVWEVGIENIEPQEKKRVMYSIFFFFWDFLLFKTYLALQNWEYGKQKGAEGRS